MSKTQRMGKLILFRFFNDLKCTMLTYVSEVAIPLLNEGMWKINDRWVILRRLSKYSFMTHSITFPKYNIKNPLKTKPRFHAIA